VHHHRRRPRRRRRRGRIEAAISRNTRRCMRKTCIRVCTRFYGGGGGGGGGGGDMQSERAGAK